MILLERWMVAVILSAGLVSTVSTARGQSTSADGQEAQPGQAPKPAPDQSAPDQSTPDQATADQATADQPTPDKPAADQTTAEHATPDKPASDQAKLNPPAPPPPGSPQEQQLQKDSAHLLQLVQELKVEVEKAGNNTLSLAALRKADEIQKLSKSLKERMKERGLVSQGKGQ